MEERSENSWGKGKEQTGPRTTAIFVEVSVGKKTEGVQKPRGIDQDCFVLHSIRTQSLAVHMCRRGQQWSTVQAHDQRCLSLRIIVVKNMHRYAQIGTSLQW